MKKLPTFVLTMFLTASFVSSILAQNAASVTWPLTDPVTSGTGLSAVVSGAVSGADELLNNMEINHYTGLNNSQRIRILGNAWPANQTTQIDTVFVQFAVTPNVGFKFIVDSLSMYISAASISTMKANVYFSKDPAFASLDTVNYSTGDASNYLSTTAETYVQSVVGDTLNVGDTLYVRIYPWVDNDPSVRTGKYACLRDVGVFGSIESLPLPSSAIWPLTDPGVSGTGLTPVISGGVKADNEFLNNMEINQYTGPQNSQRVRILGNAWPANQTTQIDTVYLQFAAGPKYGGQFATDSIALSIAASSISTMKANIYYSKDSAFTSPTQINYSTGNANNYLSTLDTIIVRAAVNVQLNNGEKIYLRIYPWVDNDPSVRTGKYFDIQNVVISGTATGVTIDLPTVTTNTVSNISTTFATSGGNISTDGGSPVTARGVCWNTSGSATISGNKTSDGTGSGSFTSQAAGLTAGTKYYLRAYATNVAGTSYGAEETFTTLDSLLIPSVSTTSASNILVKTAEAGGNVTAWGGDTVTVKGVCWNTTGNPTVSDSKTENGSGLGSFTSILYPLTENTKYYFRAYATNSIGTGYGNLDSLTTQTPAPPVTKVVAKDGSRDYTTVQAAFDDVPDNYTGTWTIFVKKGVYKEKLLLGQNKVNVILRGEDRDSTILTYDDYANIAGGTSNSYSVSIDGNDFTAINITFQNTVVKDDSQPNQQAVALSTNGDRQQYYNCKLLGYQDTYYARGSHGTGRIYFEHCYIEGAVDFIFGRDVVVFDSCEIHVNRNKCSITAASTEATSNFGFVFRYCTITNDSVDYQNNVVSTIYLGRAWQNQPRTVFMYTYEPSPIVPAGWNPAAINSGVTPALYAVYQDTGPGYDETQHASGIGSLLTAQEAADYTLANIFAKATSPDFGYDWVPNPSIVTGVEDDESINGHIPASFKLYQNYPNPFNPTTIIRYAVPKTSQVKITLFDILGREVKTLVNEQKSPGIYEVNFNAANLASGIYLYQISAGDFVQVKKMVLMK